MTNDQFNYKRHLAYESHYLTKDAISPTCLLVSSSQRICLPNLLAQILSWTHLQAHIYIYIDRQIDRQIDRYRYIQIYKVFTTEGFLEVAIERVCRQHIRQSQYQPLKVEGHLRVCGNGEFGIFPLLQMHSQDTNLRRSYERRFQQKFKTKLNKL